MNSMQTSIPDPIRPRLVLFTDLDGTLLDAGTCRYDAARPALDRLRENQVPLIICTSKTRAEVEPLRIQVANQDPFIIENGGALYIPAGYFTNAPAGSRTRDGYHVLDLGVPYPSLRESLRRIEERVGVSLVGFGDLTVEEIMQETGLAQRDAERARRREYDEPFLITNHHAMLEKICEAAAQDGLTVLPGSRFFHLLGGTDKGRACRVLIDCYRQEWGVVCTAGIGDSLNDLPMLEVVDWPFLVERSGGGHAEGVALEGLTRLQGIGPAGWAEAIKKLLGSSSFRPGLFIFPPFSFTF